MIWEGDDVDGYQISVRRTLTGRNLNTSVYGPATGAGVSVRSFVNYRVFDGMIREVWHEFDEVGLIHQLDFDLFEVFDRIEQQEKAVGLGTSDESVTVVGEIERRPVSYPRQIRLFVQPFRSDRIRASRIHEIWNWRLVGKVDDYYADNFTSRLSGKEIAVREEFSASVLAQLATFPDLGIHFDQIIANGDGRKGYRVATRGQCRALISGPACMVRQRANEYGSMASAITASGAAGLWRSGQRWERSDCCVKLHRGRVSSWQKPLCLKTPNLKSTLKEQIRSNHSTLLENKMNNTDLKSTP